MGKTAGWTGHPAVGVVVPANLQKVAGHGVYDGLYFGDGVDGKTAEPCVFADKLLAFRDMYAIDLVVGDEGLYPMIGFTQLAYNGTRGPGDLLQLLGRKISGAWQYPFNYKLFHFSGFF